MDRSAPGARRDAFVRGRGVVFGLPPGLFLYAQVVDGVALVGLGIWAFLARSRSAQGSALRVEMQVLRLHDWSVAVRHGDQRYWCDLEMPDRPPGAVPWSDWIRPVAKKDWDLTDAVTSVAVGYFSGDRAMVWRSAERM